MKYIIKYLISSILVSLCLTNIIFAETNVYELNGINKSLPVANVYVDGKMYTGSSGVRPLVIDNRMYIAATDISYMTNATVGWEPSTESVLINSSKGTIAYFKGGTSYTINSEEKVLGGDTKFYVVNKKSMIPVSLLPAISDLGVVYDPQTNTTAIIKSEGSHGDLLGNENTGTPTPPVAPEIAQPVNPPTNLPSGSNVQAVEKCSLSLSFSDNKEIFNISTGKFVEYETSVLSNPNRFVIDILGYNANSFDASEVSNSKFVASTGNYFHADTGKYRITLNLKNGVNSSDIKVENTTNGLNIIYSLPAKAYNYSSDRVNSELSLTLDSATSISQPSSNGGNMLVLTIPKTNVILKTGMTEYNDRNLTSIDTQLSGDNYVSTITLKDRVSYILTSNGSSGTVNIKFTKGYNSSPTIVIDAGHGGKDPGAVNSAMSINEKTLNLTASSTIASKLRNNGYNVIETRDSDYFVELKERSNIANTRDADLFISVHHNSGSATASGIETLYYPSNDNKTIASIMQKNLISSSGAIDRKIQQRPNLVVLNSTKMPAVLLELGFISNGNEASRLSNQEYVNTLTDAVVKSVNEYFGR